MCDQTVRASDAIDNLFDESDFRYQTTSNDLQYVQGYNS